MRLRLVEVVELVETHSLDSPETQLIMIRLIFCLGYYLHIGHATIATCPSGTRICSDNSSTWCCQLSDDCAPITNECLFTVQFHSLSVDTRKKSNDGGLLAVWIVVMVIFLSISIGFRVCLYVRVLKSCARRRQLRAARAAEAPIAEVQLVPQVDPDSPMADAVVVASPKSQQVGVGLA